MIRRLEREHLIAEIASLQAILQGLPSGDIVGRIGFASKLKEANARLDGMSEREELQASVSLYFSGDPVVGSLGIQAHFGATIIASYQDLIAKVWANQGSEPLALRGQIHDREAAQLHITNLVHGSFGFVLEEIDERGEPLFPSALKLATASTTDYLAQFAEEDERQFLRLSEEINPRVFVAIRNFWRPLHRGSAVFRLVEGDHDIAFDRPSIDRAYVRAESTEIEEDERTVEGELLGVVPYGRRFEFRTSPGDELVKGKIADNFGETYLERIHREQLVGRKWKAVLRRREAKRQGQMSEAFTLIDLKEISSGEAG